MYYLYCVTNAQTLQHVFNNALIGLYAYDNLGQFFYYYYYFFLLIHTFRPPDLVQCHHKTKYCTADNAVTLKAALSLTVAK